MKSLKMRLSVLTVSVMLAACGGGGSSPAAGVSSTSATASTPTPAPTAPTQTPSGSLQTSVSASTYTAGSVQLDFFTRLNDARTKFGVGLLAQNSMIDTAANNHVLYMGANNITGHYETDSTKPNYTGYQPLDRMNADGYGGVYGGEAIAYSSTTDGYDRLMATLYHREGLLSQGIVDVGIGVGTGIYSATVIDLGYKTTAYQFPAAGFLGLYPYDMQTNVGKIFIDENPSPFPGGVSGYGYPISVMSKYGTIIVAGSFTLLENGIAVPTQVFNSVNDPNKRLGNHELVYVPTQSLKANTTYSVTFTGTVDGTAVSRNWSFTTGA